MTIRKIFLVALIIDLLACGSAWAGQNGNSPPGNSPPPPGGGAFPGGSFQAPEIDAASGASAIALLAGVLLLAGERSRSKRS